MPAVYIRIVADFGLYSNQVAQKFEWAKTFEFTSKPDIVFIHCYGLVFCHFDCHYIY